VAIYGVIQQREDSAVKGPIILPDN
jgi:hypothetical protein